MLSLSGSEGMKILVIGLQSSLSLEIVETLKRQHQVIGFAIPGVENSNKVYEQLGIHIISGDLRNYKDISNAIKGIDIIIYVEAINNYLAHMNEKLSISVYRESTDCLMKAIGAQEKPSKLLFFSSPHIGKELAEGIIGKQAKSPWMTIKLEYELERPYSFSIVKKALTVKVLANLANELCKDDMGDLWGETYLIHINEIIRTIQDELVERLFKRYGKDINIILNEKRRVKSSGDKLDQCFDYRKRVVDELGEKIIKSLPKRLELLRFFPHFILRKIYKKRIEDEESMVRYLQEHKHLEVHK